MDLQSTPIGRSGNLPWCGWKDSKPTTVSVQSGGPKRDNRHHHNDPPSPRFAGETPHLTPKGADMADASFDVVSKVDKQEVSNALTQSQKEISQRYDFKNVGASIEWSGENILMKANSEERVLAVLDVFQTKLVKRNVSLKALDLGEKEPQLSGKEYRLEASLKDGITQEDAKKIAKMIRDEFGKTVKPLIQGDELRVSSKSKDDLQAVMTMLRSADLEVAVQFTNYR
jgi:cyclic-di-GMP-binding protein